MQNILIKYLFENIVSLNTNIISFKCTPMNTKDNIIHELYEVLEKLQYPEIVKVRFEEFENTILLGNKRLDVLLWLLQESPSLNSAFLSKLKDTSLSEKLFKCFSQIGLCNDVNVLLGKCTIDKQLQFLSLLTLFIKYTHLQKVSPEKDKQNDLENINLHLTPKSCNIHEKENNFGISTTLEVPNTKIDNNWENYSIDDLNLNVKAKMKKVNEQMTDMYKPILQKFQMSFNNVISLTQHSHSDLLFKGCNEIATDIQNIHSTFLTFNKAIINETKISNTSIPKNAPKNINSLTQVIRSNLLSIEQACNINKNYN